MDVAMLRSTAKFLVAEAGVLALPPTIHKKHSLFILFYFILCTMMYDDSMRGPPFVRLHARISDLFSPHDTLTCAVANEHTNLTLPHRVRSCSMCFCSMLGPKATKNCLENLATNENGNWSSFQLANRAPPLGVTGSPIAPSARMHTSGASTRLLSTPHRRIHAWEREHISRKKYNLRFVRYVSNEESV